MGFVDTARLRARANADAEFRIAARYWNATLSLESPSLALRVEVADGRVVRCDEGAPGDGASLTVKATEAGWTEFLAPVPRPYYQDLLGGCVQHHGFVVAGDTLLLAAYYHALQRFFAIMREVRAGAERTANGTA